MDTLQQIKEQICDVCHKMWQLGWVAANDGNVSAKLPDGRIILIRQFRYAFMKDFLEIPAGKIDEGEDILTCARRELSEEIGYDCENMKYLGKICPSCGCMNEVIHLYVAENMVERQLAPDEDEDIQTVIVTKEEALAMISSGEIDDAKTICALLRYACNV